MADFSASTVEHFLREHIRPPEPLRLSVRVYADAFSVAFVDGVGPKAGFVQTLIPLSEKFALYDKAAWLQSIVKESSRAMLALCEYPERFCG
jgi:hypothetical protein